MTEIVVADIGGTHARLALAELGSAGAVRLGTETVLRTADYSSLAMAWDDFGARLGRPLPRSAAIAVACPVAGDVLTLTNNPWTIHPASLGETLGVGRLTLCNDFVAVGHAVAALAPGDMQHVCGPDVPFQPRAVVSIVGPGTGLGVAMLWRDSDDATVIATEGGHGDFAPLDAVEDAILATLRARFGRVSVERLVAGPGLATIHATLAALEARPVPLRDDMALWAAALAGEDRLAVAALDRFCRCLGAVAGDIVLAQGGGALVLAGGIGLRLADRLATSGFAERFVAKGRFEAMMRAVPVKLLTHPQPGLYGAAVAFAREHGA